MNLVLVRIRQEWERVAGTRAILIATLGGVVLALLGPLGTDAAPLGQRLAYWLALAEVGVAFGIITSMALRRLLDPADKHVFLIAALTAACITLPVSAVVFEITKRLFEGRGRFGGSGDLLGFVPPVLVISLTISLISTMARRRPVHTRAAPPGASQPRFSERLPLRLRGADIHAVQAEDHYLRVHTSRGSDLILMRLADAVAELEGLEGAQTHRSWWVARKAVKAARRGHNRAVLKLQGDIEAPVSRTYVSALKAEGWF